MDVFIRVIDVRRENMLEIEQLFFASLDACAFIPWD
jgi:hypothetical protein